MSFNNINTKLRSERGFTIVELLIVIVVIGILAAITIVAYNGVTARANKASAQSAASMVAQKAEAYNADKSAYPTTLAQLKAGGASDSFAIATTAVLSLTTVPTTAPSNPASVLFYACGAGAGVKVGYWNYSTSAAVINTTTGDDIAYSAGVTTGTCTLSTT